MLALLVAVALAGFAAAALLSASQVMAPAAWRMSPSPWESCR